MTTHWSWFWRGFWRGVHRGVYVVGRVLCYALTLPLFVGLGVWRWAECVCWAIGACFRTEDR